MMRRTPGYEARLLGWRPRREDWRDVLTALDDVTGLVERVSRDVATTKRDRPMAQRVRRDIASAATRLAILRARVTAGKAMEGRGEG